MYRGVEYEGFWEGLWDSFSSGCRWSLEGSCLHISILIVCFSHYDETFCNTIKRLEAGSKSEFKAWVATSASSSCRFEGNFRPASVMDFCFTGYVTRGFKIIQSFLFMAQKMDFF